jgi:predicted transposase/invertase (TIGR01784 family)
MAHYLDPKNNLLFTRIFGEHPDLLKSFLNALMPLEKGQQVESLEYLPPEEVPNSPLTENPIIDVLCEDNHGRQFIVEIQMYRKSPFINEMLYNAARIYMGQESVYGLAILNDIFDKESPEFYHHYRVANDENIDEVLQGMEFVVVELPKFKAEKWADRQMAVLWLRFLKEVEEDLQVVPDELKENDDIRRALDICKEDASR